MEIQPLCHEAGANVPQVSASSVLPGTWYHPGGCFEPGVWLPDSLVHTGRVPCLSRDELGPGQRDSTWLGSSIQLTLDTAGCELRDDDSEYCVFGKEPNVKPPIARPPPPRPSEGREKPLNPPKPGEIKSIYGAD